MPQRPQAGPGRFGASEPSYMFHHVPIRKTCWRSSEPARGLPRRSVPQKRRASCNFLKVVCGFSVPRISIIKQPASGEGFSLSEPVVECRACGMHGPPKRPALLNMDLRLPTLSSRLPPDLTQALAGSSTALGDGLGQQRGRPGRGSGLRQLSGPS